MFMLSLICVIVCGLFEWKQICAGFYVLLICVPAGDPIIYSIKLFSLFVNNLEDILIKI
jgi:hypothetical protein